MDTNQAKTLTGSTWPCLAAVACCKKYRNTLRQNAAATHFDECADDVSHHIPRE